MNSRHPSLYACGRGVASRGPYATLWGSAESAGEFREANFYAQARYLRAIRPELEVHFGSKSWNLVLSTPRGPIFSKKKAPAGMPALSNGVMKFLTISSKMNLWLEFGTSNGFRQMETFVAKIPDPPYGGSISHLKFRF